MAYCFKKDEALPHGIRRIFAEEISWAVGQLTTGKNRTVAVHNARKSIKKIRALLALVKSQIGPLYKPADRYFSKAGKQLSDLRDSAVMLEVFDALAAKHSGVSALRSSFESRQLETLPGEQVYVKVSRLLQDALPMAHSWEMGDLSRETVLPDLIAAYRGGRQALKRATKRQTTQSLHSLRKHVKQHWYHVRLFESYSDRAMKKRANDLHDLETCLGDHHNLSLLRRRIAGGAETSHHRQQAKELVELIDEESRHLRAHALASAQLLFAVKPRAFWAPSPKRPAIALLHAKCAVA